MENKKEILDELKDLGSSLADIKKENPFEVPRHYFQGLPGQVMKNIARKETTSWIEKLESHIQVTFGLLLQPRYAISLAAVVLAVVSIILLIPGRNTPTGKDRSFAGLSSEEIEEYLIDNSDTYYDLVALSDQEEPEMEMEGYIFPEDMNDEILNEYMLEDIEEQILEEETL